jgi:Na+-transporting NADH:ubiquinone oxidoreductase subunit NqrD
LSTVADGGWFHPLGLMQLAPAAFFIIGLLIWASVPAGQLQIETSEVQAAPLAEIGRGSVMIDLLLAAIFEENLALSFFLGICTFLAVSERFETAVGLGIAVIVCRR